MWARPKLSSEYTQLLQAEEGAAAWASGMERNGGQMSDRPEGKVLFCLVSPAEAELQPLLLGEPVALDR